MYKRIGQFDYGQFHCTTDHIQIFNYPRYGVYIGEVKAGTSTPHGIGIKVHCGGNIEEGYWKDGKQHGTGRYIFNYGDYYTGEWKEGYKHGQGTYYTVNGDEYVGEWNGQGGWQGQIKYRDGTWYSGLSFRYMRNGPGTLYSADGQILKSGMWIDDEYVDIK